jgi:hypothetical protein
VLRQELPFAPTIRDRSGWPLLGPTDVAAASAGVLLILLGSWLTDRSGVEVGVGIFIALLLFLAAFAGFLFVPHVAAGLMIPLFALVPALKVFVGAWVGPVKDLVALSAIVAALALLLAERGPGRRLPDPVATSLVALLLGLYVVNAGGGHDVAWGQGVRLTGEPLLLLVAGLALPDPRRTLRFAVGSLIATATLVACYGLFQQRLGIWGLHDLGYAFDEHIRTFHGHLRSFGTLDDPFAYATLLVSGLAAVVFWMRPGPLSLLCGGLLAAGIYVSYVRTAGVIALALVGLWLARRGLTASAALVAAAAVASAIVVLVTQVHGQESRTYRTSSTVLTLNGRTDAWSAALGRPSDWVFGQGVGEIGTAAERAEFTIERARDFELGANAKAVDSGYLATLADVGFAGLVVLLALLARLAQLAARAARLGYRAGWIAAAFLSVQALDALTRSSFTGFPTAFLGFFLIGLALAAAQDERLSAPAVRRPPPNRWSGSHSSG